MNSLARNEEKPNSWRAYRLMEEWPIYLSEKVDIFPNMEPIAGIYTVEMYPQVRFLRRN